ncbi:Protein quaking-A [Liparis tanakae]|uniref:Protein quaking-A n=1 Tax=Liparis tanakae TaxID=230148 RepID=A0A4Z2FU07_9TELE|nr:Protein quaking-A [Liparis tanakae]
MWAGVDVLFKGLPRIPFSVSVLPVLPFVMLSLPLRGHGVTLFTGGREEQNRGKPNWEHLNEDLHVLITVEDTQGRAEIKMRRAVEEVKKLLVPAVSKEIGLCRAQRSESSKAACQIRPLQSDAMLKPFQTLSLSGPTALCASSTASRLSRV